jgi:hypothetical protein
MRPVSEAEIRGRCDVVDRAYGVRASKVPDQEAGEKMFPKKNTLSHDSSSELALK